MSFAKYGSTIAEFTKRFREEAGLSQRDLADSIGVHAQYISNIERNVLPHPVTFASLLLEHVDEPRKKYLIDMMKEAAAERVANKMGGKNGKAANKKYRGNIKIKRADSKTT